MGHEIEFLETQHQHHKALVNNTPVFCETVRTTLIEWLLQISDAQRVSDP
jgi:hypothetical protein